MDQRDSERIARRFGAIFAQPDWEGAAADAGIEVWDSGTDSAGPQGIGAAGQAGIVDPRTGEGFVGSAYPPAPTPSADYPAGWPFLPYVQAWLAEFRLGDAAPVRVLSWTRVLDPGAAAAAVVAALNAAGWQTREEPALLAEISALVDGKAVAVAKAQGVLRILVESSVETEGGPEPGLALVEIPVAEQPGESREGAV